MVAYGAFVSWTPVAGRTGAARPFASVWAGELGRVLGSGPRAYPVLALAGVSVGAVAWFLMVDPVGSISTGLIGGTVVIVLGAVIGAAYLAIEVKSMLGIGAWELTSAR